MAANPHPRILSLSPGFPAPAGASALIACQILAQRSVVDAAARSYWLSVSSSRRAYSDGRIAAGDYTSLAMRMVGHAIGRMPSPPPALASAIAAATLDLTLRRARAVLEANESAAS